MTRTETDDARTTRLPEDRCPYCEHTLDAASHTTEVVTPKPDDVTICIECAQALVFDDALKVRKPHPGELEAAFREDPAWAEETRLLQRLIRGGK